MPSVVEPQKQKCRKRTLTVEKPSLFTPKAVLFAVLASVAYLTVSYFLLGFKSDQVVLVVLFNGLFVASRASRSFITGFSVFAVYWILFDYQKAFPNYAYNQVHIQICISVKRVGLGSIGTARW